MIDQLRSKVATTQRRNEEGFREAAAPISPAGKGASLRSNFSWMLAGNGIYAVCQWVVLGTLARTGTPAVVGQFVLALAVTSPVMAFCLLQIRSVQATDVRREYEFGHYLAVRLLALAAALFVILGISSFSEYGGETFLVILAVALSACADGLSDTAYGLLQQHERLEKIARSMMLRGLLSLVAIGSVMVVSGRPFLAVMAGAATRLVIVFGFDLRNVKRVLCDRPAAWRPRWEPGKLVALVRLAAPLGLVMMFIVLNNNIPRYFVEKHLGQSPLGIFGAIGYVGVVGAMVVGALGESVTPRLSRAYVRRDRSEFLGLCLRLAIIGSTLGVLGVVVAIVAGRPVLTLLYGAAYAAENEVLVWAMVAAGVGYVASFAGYAVTAARYYRSQIPLFALVAGTNALASYILVPLLGLRGAALSLVLAMLAQLLGTLLILWHGLTALSAGNVSRTMATFESAAERA
jgi:O-antigen/teichoic acid export membrane protein